MIILIQMRFQFLESIYRQSMNGLIMVTKLNANIITLMILECGGYVKRWRETWSANFSFHMA